MSPSPSTHQAASAAAPPPPLLDVRDLKTYFRTREGVLRAVEGVSFEVRERRVLGVVGESGCGKSVTAASILRILPPTANIEGGDILYRRKDGSVLDLTSVDPKGRLIRDIRGSDISMVFQEPMTAFSPVHTVGNQITEVLRLHRRCSRDEARDLAIEMLGRVGMPKPEQRIDAYPFQLSGGMRQRAMIAMALVCHPRLLIADEPTTALDVTIEAQIIQLMLDLQREMGMAIMIITHDLSVIAEMAKSVLVMYLGEDVEYASVSDLFNDPKHPYTRELLASVPKLGHKQPGARLHTIKGAVPSLYERPAGCPFHPRCPSVMPGICDRELPPVIGLDRGRRVRCFLYGGTGKPEAPLPAESV